MVFLLVKGLFNFFIGVEWIIKNGSKYILYIMSFIYYVYVLNVY